MQGKTTFIIQTKARKAIRVYKSKGRGVMWIVRKMHDILMNLKTKNALISHLIGDTLLVLGWISFAFRTALMLCGIDSKCWKGSSKTLIHIDIIASQSCCRLGSHSTTTQRCSTRLGSGCCGGHLSKVNCVLNTATFKKAV